MATTLKYKRLNKKDMKIFFPIVLCLFIVSCKRSPVVVQDRAITKISELPVASSLDTNDLFIVSDAGTVSRSLKGRKIADAISDSAYRIRFEIDTAKINIRAEGLGGSGAWTKSGNFVSLLVNTDTVYLGLVGNGKLNVNGNILTHGGDIRADYDATDNVGGNLYGSVLWLNERGGSGSILSTGDDMYFFDNSTGSVKLSDLIQSGGHFTLTNSTITPTLPAYNLNIGSLNETTRKLKVTGSFEVTQDVHLGAVNYDVYLNDNVNLRLDESSRILFSNTGSSDNLAIYSAGSNGLRINNYSNTNGSYLDINTNYGGYDKEITDEHDVGIHWNTDRTLTFMTRNNGGYEAAMTFNGDSIHIENATEGIDYWIGRAVGTGAGSFSGDTVETDYLIVADSIYWGPTGLSAGSLWYTNTSTGAIDTAHTEPAYIGWEMEDLPTLEEYEKDVKMINGHMERRVWYIDYETKELKSQYGWDGLGMMNTQSAYMIYHEITVRWMFEQNKKIAELQKVQIPADVTNILLELNRLKFVVFTLFGLFILLIAFSIVINRK